MTVDAGPALNMYLLSIEASRTQLVITRALSRGRSCSRRYLYLCQTGRTRGLKPGGFRRVQIFEVVWKRPVVAFSDEAESRL